MIPKGKLLIIGGAEDKGDGISDMEEKNKEFEHYEILKELLPKKKHRKIEIITTGSKMQDEVKKRYDKAFDRIGFPDVGFISIHEKAEVKNTAFINRIKQAGAVFFSGGDQFRLSTIIGGSPLVDILKDKYHHDPDFIVAGTSAGAMVMSKIMICEGGICEALFKHDLQTTSGFGLIENCIVDTHFIARGRFSRLAHALIINPGHLGIGLGEDTGLLIRHGNEATCTGSGMVVIIDGTDVEQTNITDANKDSPVYMDNLRVHLMVKGCRYNIKERKMYPPAKTQKKTKA